MHSEATFQIIGRIGRIERFNKVLKFSIAISHSSKKEDGTWDEKTEWLTLTAFADSADFIEKNRKVGDNVLARGRVAPNVYKNAQEQDVYSTDLIVNSVHLLDRPKGSAPDGG